MKLHAKSIFTIALFIFAIFNIASTIANHWANLSKPFDPKEYEAMYNKSQYVIAGSKNVIGDSALLSYAGYQYIKGYNPILINADHPPLGKYIIGLFTVIFNNNHAVSVILAFINLIILSLIIYHASHSLFTTSIGAFIFSTDTILKEQIVDSPLMDIVQVLFLLLFFLFFVKYIQTKRFSYLTLSGIAAGCMSSTKLYFPALILIGVSALFIFFYARKLKDALIHSATLLILTFTTYTLSYFVYFQKGNSFPDFLGTQKWIFLFWKNNSINKPELYGNIYPLILLNKWRVWWGNHTYISYDNWSVLWPIMFISGLIFSFYFIHLFVTGFIMNRSKEKMDRIDVTAIVISLWILGYLLYFSFIPVYPRYFMMIFFPMYIVITLFWHKRFHKDS